MKKESPGTIDTWDNLYNFFLGRVRDNLHVILCFSPVGPKFAQRASQFPGLQNSEAAHNVQTWRYNVLLVLVPILGPNKLLNKYELLSQT